MVGVVASCDQEVYIWSWFAGRCGTKNDQSFITVFPLFIGIMSRSFDLSFPMAYKVVPGGANRRMGYFLTDRIYPEWHILSRTTHHQGHRGTTKRQKKASGDIERLFGVLRVRFKVLPR